MALVNVPVMFRVVRPCASSVRLIWSNLMVVQSGFERTDQQEATIRAASECSALLDKNLEAPERRVICCRSPGSATFACSRGLAYSGDLDQRTGEIEKILVLLRRTGGASFSIVDYNSSCKMRQLNLSYLSHDYADRIV